MKSKKFGFSLIELLISLIVISLIAAAFSPVISKKLKSGGLSIGVGFGGSGGIGPISIACDDIDEDCNLCYGNSCLICSKDCNSQGEYINVSTCKCENCAEIEHAQTCEYNSEHNKGIATLCDDGYYIEEEDEDNFGTCQPCPAGRTCNGSADWNCNPGAYLNNDTCEPCPAGSYCADGQDIKQCPVGTYSNANALSCSTCSAGTYNKTTGQQTCANCTAGYYCQGGSHIEICPIGTYSNPKASSCTTCADNYYADSEGSTSCKACIEGCNNCNKQTGECLGCENGYTYQNGNCLTHMNFVKIGSVYWTRRNAGDANGPVIPNTVNIYNVNTSTCTKGASSTSATCGNTVPTCWKGTTSSNCSASSSTGYSGCNRTVCNWYAANLICTNNSMSLPTEEQINSLRKISSTTSAYKQHAADFCDLNSGTALYSKCYPDQNVCSGADSNTCYPYIIRSSSIKYYILSNGDLSGPLNYYSQTWAESVRCISTSGNFNCTSNCYSCDESGCIKCNDGYYVNGNTCSACSNNCKECNSSGCIECNDGYAVNVLGECEVPSLQTAVIGSYTWTTKNPGDSGGPVIPDTVNIYNVNTSTCTKGASSTSATCGNTVPTCWMGTTSSACDASSSSGYSGCNRTLCNWYAANLICINNGMGLPSDAQFGSLRQTSNTTSTYTQYAVDLCDKSSGAVSYSRCDESSVCQGAVGYISSNNNKCFPYNVFHSLNNGMMTKFYYLQSGKLYGSSADRKSSAYSVRCLQ